MTHTCPKEVVNYQLAIHESKELVVIAACMYSSERLLVNAGETYEITCDGIQP
jgi:hypothetical protein